MLSGDQMILKGEKPAELPSEQPGDSNSSST